MGQKGFLCLELKAYNTCLHTYMFRDAVPIALSRFSQNHSLTFRVGSTVFNVLVTYLKASLIFILPFTIGHIFIKRDSAKSNPNHR